MVRCKILLEILILTTTLAGAAGAAPVDRNVTVNGLNIHYLDWGSPEKPPLILLHGIARTAHTFDHVAPHFTTNHHVLAVDMRGHGDSAWDPQGSYVVEDYVKDIAALIAQLKLRNIVLWGNSTGGRVAQMIAGQHPDLVKAVIVEDVGPERPREVSNRRADRMAKEADGWATTDDMLVQVKKENPLTPEPVLKELVRYGSKPRADGRIVWKRDPAILNGFVPTELWSTVRLIKAPIIYILGGASTVVPVATQHEIKAALPQAQIVTMPGLGHYPSDERPKEFLAIVERFLAGIPKSK
jgi:pimeloyl-ACP methyl ester carboxylesterase